MLPDLRQLLLDRLRQQGINTEEAPACFVIWSKFWNQILELTQPLRTPNFNCWDGLA